MKRGIYTTFELPSKRGICNWYGCKKSVTIGGFCEEHGKIEVKATICEIPAEPTDEFGFNKYTNNTHNKRNI
jgi:hypothetical protein